MSNSIVGVWENMYDEYGEYRPFVYKDGEWRSTITPYVYWESDWQPIGKAGTLMIPFMTVDNEYFMTSDGKMFLVRNHVKNNAVLNSIQVESLPNKTAYTAGDTFDPAGLKVTITFQNKGVTKTKEVSQYICQSTPLTVGQTSTTVTVMYLDYQTSDIPITISVVAPQISIAVTTPPTKTSYYTDDYFDDTGMVVTATVEDADGTRSYVIDDYTYNQQALNPSITEITLNWRYRDTYITTTTVPITVQNPTVELLINHQPNCVDYNEGEFFDPTGMEVQARISRGTNITYQTVTNYSYAPDTALGTQDAAIVLSWDYNSIPATANVPITVIRPYATLEVIKAPDKQVYEIINTVNPNTGTVTVDYEYFNPTGMIVVATMHTARSNEEQVINDYTYTSEYLDERSTYVTLNWTYNQQNATVNVPIAVRKSNVHDRPLTATGTDYISFDPLDMESSFSIGIKYQQTSIGTNGTVFGNIPLNGSEYGLRFGTVNGLYSLSWGTNQAMSFVNNTAGNLFSMMIEHTAGSPTVLVTYNDLTDIDNTTYTNNMTIATNAFPLLLGVGMTSAGQADTANITNDFKGHIIDFSIYNNTIPNRDYVEDYLSLEPDESQCIIFSSPTTFSLQTRDQLSHWDGVIQTSTNGVVWVPWNGTSISAVSDGTNYKLLVRGIGNTYISPVDISQVNFTNHTNGYHNGSWKLTGSNISASGNIATLLDYSTVSNNSLPTMSHQAFYGLFASNNLISINQLILPYTTLTHSCYANMFASCSQTLNTPELPATTLADYCYRNMFGSCRLLATTPNLSANTLSNYCYNRMFAGCRALTIAPTLPATILAPWCYYEMFYDCSSLISAPILPATTLANYCYNSMFKDCISLTTTPTLSVSILAEGCYSNMFDGCTSLTTAPELPATTLAGGCYYNMFHNCTSLTTAPALPATTLANNCYCNMFNSCTSLTIAPSLPATILQQSCYQGMFRDCTSLTTAPNLPATTLAYLCYASMFAYCSSLTTAPQLPALVVSNSAYSSMFLNCTSLIYAPELPATTVDTDSYQQMFYGCTNLKTLPTLPALTLGYRTYSSMFQGCTSIKISETQTGEYQLPYRIPVTGTGTNYEYNNTLTSLTNMFANTGGTFTGTPTINTTYYIPDTNYITFSSPNSFTLQTNGGSTYWDGTLQYSTNRTTWNTWNGTQISSALDGGKQVIYMRGSGNTTLTGYTNQTYSIGPQNYSFQFLPNNNSTNISILGNIGTLLDYNTIANGSLPTMSPGAFLFLFAGANAITQSNQLILPFTTLTTKCYSGLFTMCHSLISPPQLPATTLANECYSYMFYACDSLATTPELPVTTLADGCYKNMFAQCGSLTITPALPATTLAQHCYYRMFSQCTSLTTAPKLPATTLAFDCYGYMFAQCTSLSTAPELPATTLANYCYEYMFENCHSLTTVPELSATTLTLRCYQYMFSNCISLTDAPELLATTLAEFCYAYMFRGCTSLVNAPELPVTTLQGSCYIGMFKDCTSLVNAPELSATTLAADCYQSMFYGCTALQSIPNLPTTTTIFYRSYHRMFGGCTSLTTLPILPITTLAEKCYGEMFSGCTSIKLSATQTGEYQLPYRIPSTGTGTDATEALLDMFTGTGGAFTGTPTINTTYYITDDRYLTFSSPNSFTLKTNNESVNWDGTLQYSNDRITWTTWNGTEISSDLDGGKQVIYVRGSNNTYISPRDLTKTFFGDWNSSIFDSTWVLTGTQQSIDIIGNIATLLDYTSINNISSITMEQQAFLGLFMNNQTIKNADKLILPFLTLSDFCYTDMFRQCSNLITPPALPATTLANYCYKMMFYLCNFLTTAPELPAMTMVLCCYENMFNGCRSLTTPPQLPATTLAQSCYEQMLSFCTALTTAPKLPATALAQGCYRYMFNYCTSLTTAPQLPATTLAYGCYYSMFYRCSALTTAPELPATILKDNCYQGMFSSCTSLTIAPTLPATTLTGWCYRSMFNGCTSLTVAPNLPATTLASNCYAYMFQDCTALTTAPELPATTLATSCYINMFYGCSSLTAPPQLPATTLAQQCYGSMFQNCTALTTAPQLPATILTQQCYSYMFKNCTSLISIPLLSVTTLTNYCYSNMFIDCTSIKLSTTKTGEYTIPYRVPTGGIGTDATSSLTAMFGNTGGTFTGTPAINTTYYLSNTNSIVS